MISSFTSSIIGLLLPTYVSEVVAVENVNTCQDNNSKCLSLFNSERPIRPELKSADTD